MPLEPTSSPLSQGIIQLDPTNITPAFYNQIFDVFLQINHQTYGSLIPTADIPFKIIVYNCVNTNVVSLSMGLSSTIAAVGDPITQVSLPDPTFSNPYFNCGPIDLFLTETYPFLTLTKSPSLGWALDIQATLTSEIGTWPVTLNARLLNYPGTPPS